MSSVHPIRAGTSTAPEVSVVLPMFNEAAVVAPALNAVRAILQSTGRPFEIVCVDDGSTDATASLLAEAVAADDRVRVVRLSRNFGKEAALAAGLDVACGRAVIFLDADLQHPVELIPDMLARWDQGFDVVEAIKRHRGRESSVYRAASVLFYSLMGRSAGARLQHSSDFKLLDRQVVDVLAALPERARFFRGLVAWVGFDVAQIPFQVRHRAAGVTKWSLTGLARYALRNVVHFTSMPLRLVAWSGFATLLLAAILALQTFWNWWRGSAVTGFTTVILVLLGLGGLILLSIGVVALYLAQMYDEQKGRPVYVVRMPRQPDVQNAASERNGA